MNYATKAMGFASLYPSYGSSYFSNRFQNSAVSQSLPSGNIA
jgi:hypothetical protein